MAKYNTSINNFLRNGPVTSISGNYSALQTDEVIEFSSTAASYTLTLPAPSITGVTANKGKTYVIKDASGGAATNNITIAPASGTIDGVASVSINTAYGFVQVYCDGTAWFTQATATASGTSSPLSYGSWWLNNSGSGGFAGTTNITSATNVNTVVLGSGSRMTFTSMTAAAQSTLIPGTASITIQNTGVYKINASWGFGNFAGGTNVATGGVQLVKNSNTVLDANCNLCGSFSTGANPWGGYTEAEVIASLNAGDTVDARLFNIQSDGLSTFAASFTIEQIPTAVGTLTTVQPPTRVYLPSFFSSTSNALWQDTGLIIPVPAGNYRVRYNLFSGVQNGQPGTIIVATKMVNQTTGLDVPNSSRYPASAGYCSGFIGITGGSAAFDLDVSNAISNTYKVQAQKFTSSGAPDTGQTYYIYAGSFMEYEPIAAVVASSTQFTWTQVSTTSQALANGNGYYCTNAALTTLTLPASPTPGTEIKIQGTATNSGFWRIAQNAGQKIYFGNQATTTGVGGSITSTNARDSVSLLCTSVTEFEVTAAVGNLTVV